VRATRADAVVPLEADSIERTLREVLDGERVERAQRRVTRVVTLAAEFNTGDDAASLCERLAGGAGYDTAWVVRLEGASVTPVAAAGVPLSALRTTDVDGSAPWARALSSGTPVVESVETDTVAVPFDDRCLVCTTKAAVGDAEVSALEHAVRSLPSTGESLQPRYALLGKAIAHEVNNQLDVAMVHLGLVDGADDEGDEHVGHVEAALDRIDEVVDEVNALVAPELSLETVSLESVATEVWDGVSTAASDLETRDATVEADVRLLRLLLSNLFRNAVQHGGEDITVKVGPVDGGFYVDDDGAGVADGADEQLFEWGWSGEGGTGIGLALVSLAADRHGWTVEHRDTGGARFEFRP